LFNILVGFAVSSGMFVFFLLLRGPRDYGPRRRDYVIYERDYRDGRWDGSALILMLFVAFAMTMVALLTS
jgi:hypothetical protein